MYPNSRDAFDENPVPDTHSRDPHTPCTAAGFRLRATLAAARPPPWHHTRLTHGTPLSSEHFLEGAFYRAALSHSGFIALHALCQSLIWYKHTHVFYS